jgi:ubiquinone biosynthesis protein COQ9
MTEDRARKDQLIEAMLPEVAFDGWSKATLRAAARRLGLTEAEAVALLPGGPAAMVAAFSDWADRRMLAALSPQPLEAMRVRERVAAGVRARLSVLEPHREAVRRALSVLALPQNTPLGLKLLYRTVDAIWYAAGDTATDWNFYTKRGLLAGVYGATTLYWLDDRSPGSADTYGFLERRLDDVMAIPKITSRVRRAADILPNPLRFFSVARRR